MTSNKPERWMDSIKIDEQHHQIISELNNIMRVADGESAEQMISKFSDFCHLVNNHFRDEEEFLASFGLNMLAVQQSEHGILSRMLSSMLGLMETSEQVGWRSAVIGEAIDALAIHFAKEDKLFQPVLGRRQLRRP